MANAIFPHLQRAKYLATDINKKKAKNALTSHVRTFLTFPIKSFIPIL